MIKSTLNYLLRDVECFNAYKTALDGLVLSADYFLNSARNVYYIN